MGSVSIIGTSRTKLTRACCNIKKNEASWKMLKICKRVSNLRFSVDWASVNTLPGQKICFMTSNRSIVYDYYVVVTLVYVFFVREAEM